MAWLRRRVRARPQQVVERDGDVAVLGHTTGSHLGLPDDEEEQQLVIWTARVVDGRLASWHLVEDTPERRADSPVALLTAP